YRAEFEAAFGQAIGQLSFRQRNIVRYMLREGLSVEKIAVLYGVHAATARRWVAAAREALLDAVRAALQKRLGVTATELESILRLVRSELDRCLADEGALGAKALRTRHL